MSSEQEFLSKLNALMGQFVGGRQPSFRAFVRGSVWYCWNTEPFGPSEPKPWAVWKYRHNKAKGTYARVGKILYFSKRKTAKARADKWLQKAKASVKETIRK